MSQETFTIAQCAACGLQFTNPRPDAASIGKYYESAAYVSHNSGAGGLVNRVYRLVRYFTMRRKVALITQAQWRVGRAGCSTTAAARATFWRGPRPRAGR